MSEELNLPSKSQSALEQGIEIHEAIERAMIAGVADAIRTVVAEKKRGPTANEIRAQMGYASSRLVQKRKVQVRPVRQEAVKVGSNGRYISAFDTFWANVRSIHIVNPKQAPVGPIHRGAKLADAAHLLATLGKEVGNGGR